MHERGFADRFRKISLSVAAFTAVVCAVVLPFIRSVTVPTKVAYLGMILGTLGILLGYVVTRVERDGEILDRLSSRESSVEVFRTGTEWAARLLEESSRSDEVRTQMVSPAPQQVGPHMVEYFRKMHERIRVQTLPFWRLATVHEKQKVLWLFRSLIDLIDAENFSLAVMDLDHKEYSITSFQICRRGDNYSTFVFGGNVDEPGENICLIHDNKFGRVAERAFVRAWENSDWLKVGGHFELDNITKLATKYDLLTSDVYNQLVALITVRMESWQT